MFDYEENKKRLIPWERILRLIYFLPPRSSWNFKNEEELYAFFMRNSGHSKFQVIMALEFLEQQELVDFKVEKGRVVFILEKKGFEIARNNEEHYREIEIKKNQEKINSNLLQATIIVALSSALMAFVTMFNFFQNTLTEGDGKGILLMIIAIFMAAMLGGLITSVWNFIFKKE